MDQSNLNYLWSSILIEELVRNGVDHFLIAPGSRSAPLTVSVARNKKTKSTVHFDERGLGFYALGCSSAAKKPCAIITTSGTAVGNLLPAVIEASKKKVPLIILSADRPPELRHTGADQTIDQVNIFGKYAKWQFDFPCPSLDIKPEFILTTIDQAVHQAIHGMPGVVHLNVMFREPLAPIESKTKFTNYLKNISAWQKMETPFTTYIHSSPKLEPLNDKIIRTLQAIKNGLIVVGKLSSPEEGRAVLKLSERLNFPIFADITSGLRLGVDHKNLIHYFDQILLSEKVKKEFNPDGIIHLGGRMTSKRFYQFIDVLRPKHYISVLTHSLRNDPLHVVTDRVQTSVTDFCEHVLAVSKARLDDQWVKKLKPLSERLHKTIRHESALSEITIARSISEHIPKNSALFLASSMPIRDMDWYATHEGNPVIIGSNRGASGIDGTIASGLGFAAGLKRPVTIVTGDLAFLHDLNSLAMIKQQKNQVILIVINNNGGGIFNSLPIAAYKDVFEKFFGTPHGLTFKETALMFGIKYSKPETVIKFKSTYKSFIKDKSSGLIELTIDRLDNTKKHRMLQNKLASIN